MTPPASVVVEPEADRPILFVGPPRAVAADITIKNPGDRSFVLRDVGLKDRSGRLAHLPERQGVMPTVLRGGQQRQLRIALALTPTTPAGEYRVALDVLGETRHALLHVTEEVALRVEPDTLWIANAPDNAQSKSLTVTNAGNVQALLAGVRDVPLRDDLAPAVDVGLALQGLAAKQDLRADELVDALIVPLRGSRVIVGCLSLGFAGGQLMVAPGETSTLEVEITLPEPPPPNGRARALVPLMNTTLEIVVLPSGLAHAPHGHMRGQRAETESQTHKNKPRSARVGRTNRARS
jgi:hypothetical protein